MEPSPELPQCVVAGAARRVEPEPTCCQELLERLGLRTHRSRSSQTNSTLRSPSSAPFHKYEPLPVRRTCCQKFADCLTCGRAKSCRSRSTSPRRAARRRFFQVVDCLMRKRSRAPPAPAPRAPPPARRPGRCNRCLRRCCRCCRRTRRCHARSRPHSRSGVRRARTGFWAACCKCCRKRKAKPLLIRTEPGPSRVARRTRCVACRRRCLRCLLCRCCKLRKKTKTGPEIKPSPRPGRGCCARLAACLARCRRRKTSGDQPSSSKTKPSCCARCASWFRCAARRCWCRRRCCSCCRGCCARCCSCPCCPCCACCAAPRAVRVFVYAGVACMGALTAGALAILIVMFMQ